MEKKELLKIVSCIKCQGSNLRIVPNKNELVCTNCHQTYLVRNTIPIFLQNNEGSNPAGPEIHERQGSVFNYIDHYQKDAIEFDYFQIRESGTEHGEKRVREYILAQLPVMPGKILDVGCGKAWVAELCCPKNFEVVSMDISLLNVSKALEKYPFKNHSAVVADVFSLPFKENTFDCIIASEIIEHVVYPELFVKNLMYVLKPGGVLIVTTPYKEKLHYSLCIHCNKLTPHHAHIHSFDEKILANLYSQGELKSFKYLTFGNKVLIHLRTHVFLQFFPFTVWKTIDKIANLIYKVPATILVKWEKT